MTRRAVVACAAAAAALLLPAAAQAKDVSVVAVGPGGRSLRLDAPFGQLTPGALNTMSETAPARGGYLLVYPLQPTGLPSEPGRFYPQTGALCVSWTSRAPGAGRCPRAEPALARLLARAASLPRFTGGTTTIAALRQADTTVTLPNDLAVLFELAFSGSAAAVGAPPRCAIGYSAVWRGPGEVSRPTAFTLGPNGVYARGRRYPIPAPLPVCRWKRAG